MALSLASRHDAPTPDPLPEDLGLLGRGAAIRHLIDELNQVADSTATVMIFGETGTGKELVARALHNRSNRREGPFVAVNCAAIPETLIESELFGHERGAFTDAQSERIGRFEMTNGGTLFLDEIGDLSLRSQGNLLRVLEDRTVTRVGGSQPIPIDIRLVGGTPIALEHAVRDGRFREDLYHRLNVVPLRVPPLRERSEDIPLLASSVLERITRGRGAARTFTDDAMRLLVAYDWPGNVRELEGLIERVVATTEGTLIRPEDLPASFKSRAKAHALTEEIRNGSISLTDAVDAFERALILEALEQTSHVQVRAAKWLGITRRILKYKMDLLGIPVKRPRVRSSSRRKAA